jgi:uncharacterized protein (DUF169 family)
MSAHRQDRESLDRLKLDHSPIAIGFLDYEPDGLPRIGRAAAASCGYWKEASAGRAFYTRPEDHDNCAVGAFTHGAPATVERTQGLNGLVGTMIELKYLDPAEVPMIPHRTDPMKIVAYAPLAEATFPADVVVFRGNARQIMMLSEAARRAGLFDANAPMGRPACAMLPQAIGSASGVASVACIGNRVYTELSDNELYLAVPGQTATALLNELDTILDANAALEEFHRHRAQELSA